MKTLRKYHEGKAEYLKDSENHVKVVEMKSKSTS